MTDWVIALTVFATIALPTCAWAFAYWDVSRRKERGNDATAILSREIANLRTELHQSQEVLGNRMTEANSRISNCERNLKDALGSRPAKTTVPIMPFGSKQQR